MDQQKSGEGVHSPNKRMSSSQYSPILHEKEPFSDEEIRRELWKGTVPIVFDLTPNEVTTLQPPPPYYMLAHRNNYLPLVSSGVTKHFSNAAAAMVDEIWFEFRGKPLKWHYPIGLLFDLYGSKYDLPWTITVHFQGYPSEIMRCPNEATVKSQFTNQIKESNFIKNGDSSKIYDLSVNDTTDLWEGVKNNDLNQYWKSNYKLIPELSSLKYIPVRIFQIGTTQNISWIQSPVSPIDDKGNYRTLKDLISEIVPSLEPLIQESKATIMIQGISPSLDTPILWLSENLSYPDNFLYIIVK